MKFTEIVYTGGCGINADGSNGQSEVEAAVAIAMGLYVDERLLVGGMRRLATYHGGDWDSPKLWIPAGRKPLGLDMPENGGRRVDDKIKGYGFVCVDGVPLIQGPNDPAPTFYVSQTALFDHAVSGPGCYFDSYARPGWTIPHGMAAHLGDLALIEYGGAQVWAEAFDVGPSGPVELSMRAAKILGINSDPRDGGTGRGVKMTIYAGSHKLHGAKILTGAQMREYGKACVTR